MEKMIEVILGRLRIALEDLDSLSIADEAQRATAQLAAIQVQFAIDLIDQLQMNVH